MAVPESVTDIDDPRLAAYRAVRERDLRGDRAREGRFVGEQRLIVERMLALPGVTESVLCLPSLAAGLAPLVPAGVPLYMAEKPVMAAIAGFPIHRGVLAIGRRPSADRLVLDAAVPRRPGPLSVLACEDITHPDNVGMLFRTAAAFGVDAVLLTPGSHDPLYRRAIRMSIGHVLGMPWAWATSWPDELDRLAAEWGMARIGAATGGGAVALDDAPRPERLVLVVGTESHGLSLGARARLDLAVRIPMAPGIDSLNVSVAAAVCLHRLAPGVRA